MVAEAGQRPSMPGAERAIRDRLLDTRRRLKDTQRVGDRWARTSDALRHTLLRQSEGVHEVLEGARLLDGVEVGALDVLDQRDLELLLVR